MAEELRAKIQIISEQCSVRLEARNAPLSDVLGRLAESLGFQLQLEGSAEGLVNVDLAMPAPQLVGKLLSQDSAIVGQAHDPHCPGQNRIVKIWLLANGKEVRRPPARVETAPLVQDHSARYEEMSRRTKEAYEAYVRAHGEPPPGAPEEAVTKIN